MATKNDEQEKPAVDVAGMRKTLREKIASHMVDGLRFGAGKEWLRDAAKESAEKKAGDIVDKMSDDEVPILHKHFANFI